MRSAPANYLALLDNPSLNPVWLVQFIGVSDNRGLFCSGEFADITEDYKKDLVNVRLRFGAIDLLEPHTGANEYEFEIADKDLVFTNVLKDFDILGRFVTIKIGFAELEEADFVTLPTVTVESIELLQDYLTWRIRAKDEFFRIKKTLFTNLAQTNLDGDSPQFDSTVKVESTTGFLDPDDLPGWIKTCLSLDKQEIKIYADISGADFINCIVHSQVARVSHDSGTGVRQAIGFTCNQLIILLHILTTTDSGGNGFYDLGIPGFGLGIPATSINVDNIEKIAYRIGTSKDDGGGGELTGNIVITQPESLSWIEKMLLQPLGCYFFSNDGKIDVGALDYVWHNENFTSQRDFINEEIVEAEFEFIEAINVIRTQSRFNPSIEAFKFLTSVQLDDSVIEYGINSKPFENVAYGFVGDPGFLVRGFYWNRRFFDFYGDMAANITFSALPRCWLVEPGDDVRLTYDYLPDLIAGTRGWTNRKIKILGQEIDFAGECKFTGITYQIFDRVAGLTDGIYIINKVEALDIDESNVQYSENFLETPDVIEAEDGYYDNSGTDYEADLIVFLIELQEPGTGSGEQTIAIRISAVDGTMSGDNVISQEYKAQIRYDAAGSATREIPMYLYIYDTVGGDRFDDIDHIKVEWVDRSSSDPDDQPTITFTGAWFVNHARAMSLV